MKKYPFHKWQVGQKDKFYFDSFGEVYRARAAAHAIGCRMRWKFKTTTENTDNALIVERVA